MNSIKEWPSKGPDWQSESLTFLINQRKTVSQPDVKLTHLIESSDKFPVKFPVQTVRCKMLKDLIEEASLEKNINSVYPIVHEHALWLYVNFILFKRKHGTSKERELYADITLLEFVNRLLKKRAVSFMGKYDSYSLLDGTEYYGNWEIIGTDAQTEVLNLKKYISYDEIKLSALMSVSSHTYFINDGNRHNKGVVQVDKDIEKEGIIIGLIGARFARKHYMEYQDILVTKDQNTESNGYGSKQTVPTVQSVCANLYEKPAYLYEEVNTEETIMKEEHFIKIDDDRYFDKLAYAKRLALSFDVVLLEANQRANLKQKFAFVHVVGIGLGVWRILKDQNKIFYETFCNRIKVLGKVLHSISDVFFAYIQGIGSDENSVKNGELIPIPDHPAGGIKIHIGKRQPHEKLLEKDKLLIASYAWDGNALPGNEFWIESLNTSGDPAAACSTQIAELHNPHINAKVDATELRIATLNGLLTFNEYQEEVSRKCAM